MRHPSFPVLLLITCSHLFAQGRNVSGGPLQPEQACFDVQHYELRLAVDPEQRSIEGRLVMTAQITKATKKIFLDLDSQHLDVKSVSCMEVEEAESVPFVHESGKIQIPRVGK